MSLRILFADDSMTAQNMGKKILSEAGYDVVAVSNGAAAVKKIAEQKPDIIILDVYMPGYSGLEVCEKVRGSLDTMKTPVLLTVGKMEPYKPEDANRVKADGVIIKPFEASDLLAIMKKFEERIAQTAVPPMVQQTVRLEREYQEDAIAAAEPEHHATGKTGMQPMVEVPDHMAGAAAFNDMLGADSSMAAHHFGVSSPAAAFETSVIVPAPPIPTAEYEVPTSWREEKPEPMAAVQAEAEPEVVVTRVEAAPEPIAEEAEPETVAMEALAEPEESTMSAEASVPMSADAAAASHPQFIPVYKEPEAEAGSYEVVPTGAPPTGDMEIPREPELQETANETTRTTVADHVEPGLLSAQEKYFGAEPERVAAWSSSANSTSTASEPISAPTPEVAPPENELAPLPGIRATGEVTDIDFEARVAAAMAAYNNATESAPATAEVSESSAAPSAGVPAEPSDNAVQAAEIVGGSEEAPSFEYRPPVRASEIENAFAANKSAAMPEISASPIVAEQVVATPTFANPVSSPPAQEPKASEPEVIHDAVTSGVEAAAVAAASETGADHHNIAQAVHRVMERLKPELVEEIMRELRSRK
ncbi:MAG: response regulator receiver protein [Candidatus Angelobacter sp.]|nr:response regulator receiver protein [Candidatus Angelobacter sp.]